MSDLRKPPENSPESSGEQSPLAQETRPAREPRLSSRSLLVLFFFGMLLAGLYLAYSLFAPFLDALILAIVFAAIGYPLYTRILKLCRNHKNLAAFCMVLLALVLSGIPLFILIAGIIPQMRDFGAAFIGWMNGANLDALYNSYLASGVDWVQQNAPFIEISEAEVKGGILSFSRNLGQTLLGFSTGFVGVTVTFAFNYGLFLVVFFFFTRDGAEMIRRIKYLTPLREEQEDRIFQTLRRISKAVLAGFFLVAVCQGIAGGIGLAIVGIPALFWGTVMIFASLVPIVGSGLVWIPSCIYLFTIGRWKSAIFLLIWCGVGVTSIDTFLRPLLMREASGIPILFIFLSLLGGLQAFGMLGLLYGPLILTFAVVMLALYADEYREHLEKKH